MDTRNLYLQQCVSWPGLAIRPSMTLSKIALQDIWTVVQAMVARGRTGIQMWMSISYLLTNTQDRCELQVLSAAMSIHGPSHPPPPSDQSQSRDKWLQQVMVSIILKFLFTELIQLPSLSLSNLGSFPNLSFSRYTSVDIIVHRKRSTHDIAFVHMFIKSMIPVHSLAEASIIKTHPC